MPATRSFDGLDPVQPEPSPLDVIWLTAGLSCDGDTIAMTAATQPSIEDLVLGGIPGLPCVRLHNPVLAYENGDAFLHVLHEAAAGRLSPFILVVEGSIPNENNKSEGCWAGLGVDPVTEQPIPTCQWIDRLVPRAWAVVAAGTCAAYGGIHAMFGNPTGCMGLVDYLGWDPVWKSYAKIPIVCVPGCPVQPDNFMETLLYLLYQATDKNVPMIPLDDKLRPTWLFGQTLHEGCDRAGFYEEADFALVHRQARLLGAGRAVQRRQARLDERYRRLSQRRRRLHRLHHARLSRQVHATVLPRRAAGRQALLRGHHYLRPRHPQTAAVHASFHELGTTVETPLTPAETTPRTPTP
jgi:hypothetical protein